MTRSSVETSKFDLANALRSAFELCGCEVNFAGSYPGWTPNVKSEILDLLVKSTKNKTTKNKSVACHAGLECGILGTNYPDMDMISFGPTITRSTIHQMKDKYSFISKILEICSGNFGEYSSEVSSFNIKNKPSL